MKFSELLKEYLELREEGRPRFSAIRGEEDYAKKGKAYFDRLGELEAQMDAIVEATTSPPPESTPGSTPSGRRDWMMLA